MLVPPKVLNAEMLKLAVPLLFSNLATVLIGVTDTYFAGQLGTVALGAAGLGVMWYGGGLLEIWLAPFVYLALLAGVYWWRWQAGHWRTASLGAV